MREMEELESIEQMELFINKHYLSFIYVLKTNCAVCHALLPQVLDIMSQFPQIQLGHINVDHLEEIAGRLSIFTVPVLLLYIDGKEYLREARFVHLDELKFKLDRIYSNTIE